MHLLRCLPLALLATTVLATSVQAGDIHEVYNEEMVKKGLRMLEQGVADIASGDMQFVSAQRVAGEGTYRCLYSSITAGPDGSPATFLSLMFFYEVGTGKFSHAGIQKGHFQGDGAFPDTTVILKTDVDDRNRVWHVQHVMGSDIYYKAEPDSATASRLRDDPGYSLATIIKAPAPCAEPPAEAAVPDGLASRDGGGGESLEGELTGWWGVGFLFSLSPVKTFAGLEAAVMAYGGGLGLAYYYPVYTEKDGGWRGYLPVTIFGGTEEIRGFASFDVVESLWPSVDGKAMFESYAAEVGILWRPFLWVQFGAGWAWSSGANLPNGLCLSVDILPQLQ